MGWKGIGILAIVLLLLIIIALIVFGLIRKRNRNRRKAGVFSLKMPNSAQKHEVVVLSTEMFEKLQYGSKKRSTCLYERGDDDSVYRPCSTMNCNCQFCLLPIDIESTAQTAMIESENK